MMDEQSASPPSTLPRHALTRKERTGAAPLSYPPRPSSQLRHLFAAPLSCLVHYVAETVLPARQQPQRGVDPPQIDISGCPTMQIFRL
jgi:hypothetical protein